MMNPFEKKSVALRYCQGNPTPRLNDAGEGYLAERVVAIARERGLPIVKDSLLIDLSAILDTNFPIPKNAYRLTAELLDFLCHMDARFRDECDPLTELPTKS
jgi:flagellar biosynthesis protein